MPNLQLWKKANVFLGTLCVLSVIMALPLLRVNVYYIQETNKSSIFLHTDFGHEKSKTYIYHHVYHAMTATAILLVILINCVLSVLIFYVIFNHSLEMRKTHTHVTRTYGSQILPQANKNPSASVTQFAREIRLSLYTLLVFCTMMLFFVSPVLRTVGGKYKQSNKWFSSLLMVFTTDLFTMINPFALVAVSGTFREALVEFSVNLKNHSGVWRKKIAKCFGRLLIFCIAFYLFAAIVLLIAIFDVGSVCFYTTMPHKYDQTIESYTNFCYYLMECDQFALF